MRIKSDKVSIVTRRRSFKYGEPVQIELPADDEATDASAGRAGGASSSKAFECTGSTEGDADC